jgi:putative ABC transport system permease protein
MRRRRSWFLRIVGRSLLFRKGRSLLLLAVVAMAASLVTALAIVTDTIGQRVAAEVRQYGANLVILPQAARLDVGSGGFSFGSITEAAYLRRDEVAQALALHRAEIADYSVHLHGLLQRGTVDLPAEGVDFAEIRRLFPWWQLEGEWPDGDGAVVGTDLAASLSLRVGAHITVGGPVGATTLRVRGVVATGGEEDRLLFVPIGQMQVLLGRPGDISQARLVAVTGRERLERVAGRLQADLPRARVLEVRRVARTSEGLLRKVQLLMLLVTVMVLGASGGSVSSTMSTTVLERGKEIGLQKAIGGSRRAVVALFAAEAAAFGLLGGIVGYLLGVGFAQVVARTVFATGGAFAPQFLPLSMGVGLALTLVGSLGPLTAVFKLDPVRSLRGE